MILEGKGKGTEMLISMHLFLQACGWGVGISFCISQGQARLGAATHIKARVLHSAPDSNTSADRS